MKSTYNKCFKAIGGHENKDVVWYTSQRPKTISRDSFFEAAVFAVWVSGLKRKSAVSFLGRAEENGFCLNFRKISKMTATQWVEFKTKLHGNEIPPRANGKWDAIWTIAMEMSQFRSDVIFRDKWFSGKTRSSRLDNEDVNNLRLRKIPYIAKVNSHFIVRNMGGESIKFDRWLKVFIDYYKISEEQLLKALEKANIPAGLFDLVVWAYCEMFILKTKKFDCHFKNL